MRYRKYIIFLIILFPSALPAQKVSLHDNDITGLWKGTMYNDTTKQYYRYEIAISLEKGKLSGYSHTWFLLGDKRYYGLKKVKIKKAQDGKIIIEDNGMVSNNYPVEPAKNVRQSNVLALYQTDNFISLEGLFSTNRTREFNSLTGIINLKRQEDYWQADLIPHLEELGLEKKLSFIHKDHLANNSTLKGISYPLNRVAQSLPGISPENEIKISEDIITEQIEILPSIQPVNTGQQARGMEDDKKVINPSNEKNKIVEKDNLQAFDNKEAQKDPGLVEKRQTNSKDPTVSIKKQSNKMGKGTSENNKVTTGNDNNATSSNQKPVGVVVEQKNKLISNSYVSKEKVKRTESIPPAPVAKNIEKIALPGEEKKAVIKKDSSMDIVMKVQDSRNLSPIPVILDDIKKAALEVKARNNIVQQTVFFSSDSLELSLFDNGEVDGDTVSVLMNGNLIIAQQRLSTNAFRKKIYTGNLQDSIELIMYAENLGSIPPNTGLLVVRDGRDIYEIRFRGDLQKNAAIILKRKK